MYIKLHRQSKQNQNKYIILKVNYN